MIVPRGLDVLPARTAYPPDQQSLALATKALKSPIAVPASPPTFLGELGWLKQRFDLLTLMPAPVQAALAINPGELASLMEGVLDHLQSTRLMAQAADLSGQHAELFGLPELRPEQAEVFSGVLRVADDLGATHEQLLRSAHEGGRRMADSLLFMHNLVFWLYEKVLTMLTQLLAEQEKLQDLHVELQIFTPHSIVEHNHQVVSPQIRKRRSEMAQDIRSLGSYLDYLGQLGKELHRATTIPEYALGLQLARPTVVGGV